MKTTVSLETKDVREALARFLNIPTENVIPQRYGFAVTGMNASDIAKKIYGEKGTNQND